MSMTPEQFADNLRNAIEKIKSSDPPLRLAAYTTLGVQAKRIFTDGLNSSGASIGRYSSKFDNKPLYINPKTAFNGAKLGTPRGKFGETTFKSGKKKDQPHKTVYVDSYSEYRQLIGRESVFVNLELSGDLKSDFENPKGGTPTPTEVNTHEYITQLKGFGDSSRGLNIKKVEGNEKRFGDIFNLTTTERDLFFKTASFELRKLLAGG